MQRRACYFSGHVQGVGFRYTTEELAGQFDVAGFVRNLPDGRVEMVVEGSAGEIDNLISAIQQRMGQFIRKTDIAHSPASGEFQDFSIRH